MTAHSLLHPWFSRLRTLVLIALAVSPSCGDQPLRRLYPRPSAGNAVARPSGVKTPQARQPQPGLEDPRYRPSNGLAELRAVAGKVAKASGHKIHWKLQTGANPGPLVRISGNVDNCTIYVHPVAATKVSPNTWAFLFGHEFAHFTEKNLASHSPTNPNHELKADITGARYAMAAGYRIEAFLGWVLTEPNKKTVSHGSLHRRVQAIAAHFGVPQAVVREQSRRASRYRAAH